MITAATLSSLKLIAPKADAGGASSAKTPSASDLAAQKRADDKLRAMRDAIGSLKATASSASSSGAQLAKQKLEALKQRLKMLMMMGGDPKTVAKEAAQIAKEIGKVAKDYADAAGGSDAGAASDAASETTAAQQTAASADGDQTGDKSASTDQAGGDQATAATTDTKSAANPTDASTSKADDSADKTDPQKAAATSVEPAKTSTTHTNSGAGKSRLPDPTIEEARVLEASAQAIAKAALRRLKAEHKNNPDAKAEQDNLDQGEKDFKDAAKEIYGDTGGPSSDPSGGYSAQGAAVAPSDAAPSPTVSVKA